MTTCDHRQLFKVLFVGLFLASCSATTFKGRVIIKKTSKNNDLPATQTPLAEVTASFSYGKGVKPALADYLFVLDNSSSMGSIAVQVSDNMAALPLENFPADTKIAVMTTMAAKLDNFLEPHIDINRYTCIEQEPGFLSVIDAAAVTKFQSCPGVGTHANAYSIPVCDQGWFSPGQENQAGQRCFTAALQSPFTGVGCEAGLLSVYQAIKKAGDKPFFRADSAVNITFMSDEQLGCKSPETLANMPGFTEIRDAIIANSKVASVTLNGIIPLDKNVAGNSKSYKNEIAASGGYSIDVTAARSDYLGIIRKIATTWIVPAADFKLERKATQIISVKVDGVETKDFTFDQDRTVHIANLNEEGTRNIEIQFQATNE